MIGPIAQPPKTPIPHTIEFDSDNRSAGTASVTAEMNTGKLLYVKNPKRARKIVATTGFESVKRYKISARL